MTDQVVVPLRPRTQAGNSDAAALNDIHALLTTTGAMLETCGSAG